MFKTLPIEITNYIYDFINDNDFYYNISLVIKKENSYVYKRREKIKNVNGIKNMSYIFKHNFGVEDILDITYLKNILMLNGKQEYIDILKDLIECFTNSYTFINRYYIFKNLKISFKKHVASKYHIFRYINNNLHLSIEDKCKNYLNILNNTQTTYNDTYICCVTRLDNLAKRNIIKNHRLVYALIY
jgi:hypothetical protein